MEFNLIFVVEFTRIGIDFLELNGIGIDKKELTPNCTRTRQNLQL